MNPLSDILINENYTISQTMTSLGISAAKCLIVIDGSNKLLGTISDGDLRRAILSGLNLDSEIKSIYCQNPFVVTDENLDQDEIKQLMLSNKIELIPVVNSANEVVDYHLWSKLFKDQDKKYTKFHANVVVMAGGKGERLKPFTNILPKPLIPLNEKPILMHVIENFLPYGLKDFYITVNYKSRIIKAFFEEEKKNFCLNYIEESKPLGTAGSLNYLNGKITNPCIVTNCDILVEADYHDIFEFHLSRKYDITIVASKKSHSIPYGICEIDKQGDLIEIIEKPSKDYLINVGFYILNPNALNIIPKDEVFHMTDLIELAKSKKFKIGVYTIGEDDWIDTGQWNEFEKAIEIL